MTPAAPLFTPCMSVGWGSSGGGERPLRLLMVDDCRDNADSLTSLFKFWGVDVEVAYGGEAAVAKALTYHPGIMFIDLAMPIMNGCEVVRRLRGLPGFKDALMVAVTGYADPLHRQQAAEAGFDLFFTKPVAAETLREVLTQRRGPESRTTPSARVVN